VHAVDDHEAERTTDTDDDFNTDTESEHESDHEEGELRWKKPKAWDRKVRAKPFLRKLGDLVWKVPVHRDSVESEDTGLHVHPRFEMRAGDKWLPIQDNARRELHGHSEKRSPLPRGLAIQEDQKKQKWSVQIQVHVGAGQVQSRAHQGQQRATDYRPMG